MSFWEKFKFWKRRNRNEKLRELRLRVGLLVEDNRQLIIENAVQYSKYRSELSEKNSAIEDLKEENKKIVAESQKRLKHLEEELRESRRKNEKLLEEITELNEERAKESRTVWRESDKKEGLLEDLNKVLALSVALLMGKLKD